MVKIDFWIFGYREIIISPEKLSEVTSVLLRSKIPSSFSPSGKILIRERDFPKAADLLKKHTELSFSESKGLFGYLKRLKHKRSLVISSVISLFLITLSSNIVWDVRVEGNESVPDVAITEALSESGVSVGRFFGSIDKNKAEVDLLSSYPEISWINLNRRGTVIYATVSESENITGEDKEEKRGFSNVVSEYDCVIDEITVKRGHPLVKAGDVVKKGDILISGVVPGESGTVLCYAEGRVIGRISEKITAECDRIYTKKEAICEKTQSFSIKIFDFQINIFKKYGNLQKNCDIIEEINTLSLLGGQKLPIQTVREKTVLYKNETENLSDADLISVTAQKLSAKTALRLSASDLLSIRTWGEFTEEGYKMTSEIVFLNDVGRDLSFVSEK